MVSTALAIAPLRTPVSRSLVVKQHLILSVFGHWIYRSPGAQSKAK